MVFLSHPLISITVTLSRHGNAHLRFLIAFRSDFEGALD